MSHACWNIETKETVKMLHNKLLGSTIPNKRQPIGANKYNVMCVIYFNIRYFDVM